ncbi:hypothetical protein GCM10007304_46980 [Rhodococcoides trifolii]|uniref:Uncharacterized protein n=1 Tax=Rhodococcoides trifolii TaxID=908250 RepID=A0A917LIB2_9NOCA|nr:hypothetical protein GCM10007304_46980 [Rhodococcus trifolii]
MIAIAFGAAIFLIVARVVARSGTGRAHRVAQAFAPAFALVSLAIGVALLMTAVGSALFGGGRHTRL